MQHPFDVTHGLRDVLSEASDAAVLELLGILVGDILRPRNPAGLDVGLLPDDFLGYVAAVRLNLERERVAPRLAALLVEQIATMLTAVTVPDMVRRDGIHRFVRDEDGLLPWDDVAEHMRLTGFAVIDDFLDVGALAGVLDQVESDARTDESRAGLRVYPAAEAPPTFDPRSVLASAVVLPRAGLDEGVTDVLNPELAYPALEPAFDGALRSKPLVALFPDTQVAAASRVCFAGSDATRTRGFHLSGLTEGYGALVYASDVRSVGDGPLAVFPTSQDPNHPLKLLNLHVNRKAKVAPRAAYDMLLADERYAIPLLGRAGTLVLYASHALHRHLPSAEGREFRGLEQAFADARSFYPLTSEASHPRIGPAAGRWLEARGQELGGAKPAAARAPVEETGGPAVPRLAGEHFRQYRTQYAERFAQPFPWTTLGATRFFEEHLRSDMRVLEFGGGGSTLWWCERVASLTTVESGPDWAAYLLLAMTERPELLRKWKLVMAPCTWRKRLEDGSVDTSRWHFWHDHRDLLEEVDKDRIERDFWDNLHHDHDVLFVDSTNRWDMFRHWTRGSVDAERLRMIIVDNTENDQYASAMENFLRRTSSASTSTSTEASRTCPHMWRGGGAAFGSTRASILRCGGRGGASPRPQLLSPAPSPACARLRSRCARAPRRGFRLLPRSRRRESRNRPGGRRRT